MARSSYIYVVFQKNSFRILGTFTVKHEMLTFITGFPSIVHVRRYRDGRPEESWSEVELPGA